MEPARGLIIFETTVTVGNLGYDHGVTAIDSWMIRRDRLFHVKPIITVTTARDGDGGEQHHASTFVLGEQNQLPSNRAGVFSLSNGFRFAPVQAHP